MQRDACGICNGANRTATFVTNSDSQIVEFGIFSINCIIIHYFISCLPGYHDLTVIPAGARRINIADQPFLTTFIGKYSAVFILGLTCDGYSIALLINSEYILNGNFMLNSTTQFAVADNEYEYFRSTFNAQEDIFTAGPLT